MLLNRRFQGQRTKGEGRVTIRVKRRNTHVKTQYMVNSEGTILLHKTGHDRGRIIHDYEIFKNKHPTAPLQVENVLDLGYLRIQNDFPTVKSVLPIRKKRKKEK